MKTSSKLLIAASLLAASGVAGATVVTYTFNDGSLTTTVANGSNGAANPNISSIGAGYYDGSAAVAGGAVGYYNSYGFGVYSPDPFAPSNCNNSGGYPRYRNCSGSPDEHFIDNNSNTSKYDIKTSSGGSWSTNTLVNAYDDFARFRFTSDVRVTSVTIGLWDWDSEKIGTEQYCKYGYGNYCFQWGTRDVLDYFIDISFNVGDSLGGTWITQHVDLGHSAPSQGQSFVLNNFGNYGINDYFSLGAGFGLSNTGFKIKSLTVDDSPPGQLDCNAFPDLCPGTVPEPGTLSSLGLGALAMAAVGRLRRRRAV